MGVHLHPPSCLLEYYNDDKGRVDNPYRLYQYRCAQLEKEEEELEHHDYLVMVSACAAMDEDEMKREAVLKILSPL